MAILLCGALLGQLPATARVLVHKDAPDFNLAGDVVAAKVPADGVVLYDRPAPVPQSRSGFYGEARYLSGAPPVLEVEDVARHPRRLPPGAPVFLLVNGQCAEPGFCTPFSSATWHQPVPGWRVAARFDSFTLYEPISGQSGRVGAIAALRSVAEALGPQLGYMDAFAAAALLEVRGRPQAARSLTERLYAEAGPEVAARIRHAVGWDGVDERAARSRPGL